MDAIDQITIGVIAFFLLCGPPTALASISCTARLSDQVSWTGRSFTDLKASAVFDDMRLWVNLFWVRVGRVLAAIIAAWRRVTISQTGACIAGIGLALLLESLWIALPVTLVFTTYLQSAAMRRQTTRRAPDLIRGLRLNAPQEVPDQVRDGLAQANGNAIC